MADPTPPAAPQFPWLLLGGTLLAAWWWEKKYRKKGESTAGLDEDEEEADAVDVEWTDQPIPRKSKKRLSALADLGGPVSDTYIQPIKLAANGHCDEAVKLLEKQSRAGDNVHGEKKKLVVRRALRRASVAVTEGCPKEVAELANASADLLEEIESVTSVRLPTTGRVFVPTRDDLLLPTRGGAKSFDPRTGIPVPRTRGEAGRLKRRTGGKTLEYRRKGDAAWRVIDEETGEETERRVPTGKPRGRPKKLV